MKNKTPKKSLKKGLDGDEVRIVRECPLCQSDYELDDMDILEEKSGTHLLHATCPHCKNSILSVVVISPLGLSSVGMMTDLDASDVRRLHRREPVTEDEVLEFHSLVRRKNCVLFDKLI